MRYLSLFDGIACGRLVLNNLGLPVTRYVASEIDPNAIKVAKSNWNDIEHVGDVTKFSAKEGEFDVIICGSPCQGFSCSGKRLNFEDPRSKLFWEFVRILKECKPKYFFLENNKMKQEHEDIISEVLGVKPLKIDAGLVSCQHRERFYWTNLPNCTVPADRGIMLSHLIGDYDKKIWIYPRGHTDKGVYDYEDKCPTITISSWAYNFFYLRNGQKVAFTPEQVEQIQGLPIGYTNSVSKTQRFARVGNGWSIPVIEHLFSGLKNSIGA